MSPPSIYIFYHNGKASVDKTSNDNILHLLLMKSLNTKKLSTKFETLSTT